MKLLFEQGQPAIFLGIADFIQLDGPHFPVGSIDIFRLSQIKSHTFFPAIIKSQQWVVLASSEFLLQADISKWHLKILDEQGVEFGKGSFAKASGNKKNNSGKDSAKKGVVWTLYDKSELAMFYFCIDATVKEPGKYTIFSCYDEKETPIGSVNFIYQKAPILTPDKIKALESNPESSMAIRLTLGCKKCPTKLRAYTGLTKLPELEKDGWIHQTDLGEKFSCKCGSTQYSLRYLKESMHGLLFKNLEMEASGLSYVRQYGHAQMTNIADEFIRLLDKEKLEQPVQEFIEQHPTLLARFHAKRLFLKPNIVGKFKADFALVDSRDQLWLIELEKPSMQLFKKDGHPTQALMHAYGQVTDWLYQYSKFPGAVLDTLKLGQDEVVAVHGAVIAGRSKDKEREFLKRHLRKSPYPEIEFMTCDDLAANLREISKRLA